MDNKLSELSKPEQFDAEVEIHGGEPFAVWAPAVNGSHIKAELYFSLLAELEAKTDFSDKAIERISGLEKACDKYLRQTKKAEYELLAAKERIAALEAIANEYQQLMYHMDAGGDFYEFQRDKAVVK